MTQNTYDLNNPVRDVSEAFDLLVAERPSFLNLLGGLGTTYDLSGLNPVVTNNKYEWINESLEQFKGFVLGFGTDGDGTSLELSSTAGIQAGSILRFTANDGSSKSELVLVDSVDSASVITVTRDYGSTTGVTLIISDIYYLVSTPRQENSGSGDAFLQQGVAAHNFTEIFDEVANLSRSAMASRYYDSAGSLSKQIMAGMIRCARKIESSSIFSVPVARTSTAAGSMGGVLHYISGVDGNIVFAGGAISQDNINDGIEKIYAKGGLLSQPVILCSPNQARRLSALNTSGTNPIVQKSNEDRSLGNYVTNFVGDLPIDGSAVNAQIFSSQSMAKDQIAVLDMDLINLKVMSGLSSKDATANGTDGRSERLLTELTLEVKSGDAAHALITGLTI